MPRSTGFAEAFAKVPFKVSFASTMDDTAELCDLILPDHHALESWGDAQPVAGTPSYGPIKLLKLASDGLFSFSVVPLRAASLVGLIAIVLSAAFSTYTLYAKLFLHRTPAGFTSLMLFLSFFSGVQLFFLGIIGEYIGRIYQETKRRPLYVVDSVVRGTTTRSSARQAALASGEPPTRRVTH